MGSAETESDDVTCPTPRSAQEGGQELGLPESKIGLESVLAGLFSTPTVINDSYTSSSSDAVVVIRRLTVVVFLT